ncbi:serine hydrolase domain-containing protein [Kribbella sp. NPDC051952]|uniref:serine hydrolase domain-containing protein n=1 Tax=Kribbella sp. NPDC051952 TaxID=3154851 RepID=UPI0034419374
MAAGTADPLLHGDVAEGFGLVADAFAENFRLGLETGASCVVYLDGREVVQLWAGTADPETVRPWDASTTAMVYSTTKGVAAICANLLVQRGLIDLDRPVAAYWPEFGAAGKESLPVRMLLNHQAGLPLVDAPVTFDDVVAGEPVVAALAAQAPVWTPGSAHGYHAVTFGWLVGELVRRVTGRSLGTFFADEVARPLGLDFWIGLPDSELDRVAREVPSVPADPGPPTPQQLQIAAAFGDPASVSSRTMFLNGALAPKPEPPSLSELRRLYRSEVASINGIGTARSLARLYAACVSEVDGVRLLGDDTVERARQVESDGPDRVLFVRTRFGLGFWLPTDWSVLLGPASFGHPGAGGSLGFGDAAARIGFGYVPNRLSATGMGGDPRKERLLDALRRSLG